MIDANFTTVFSAFELDCPEILKTDAYLASSLLQKAIRRSDRQYAATAVLALWLLRGSNTWRRLVITAFEDVGIGAADAVEQVVTLARSNTERDKFGGEVQALLHATDLLCEAPKDRSTDYLISAALSSPEFGSTWKRCSSSTFNAVLALVSDSSAHLAVRTIAAWYCSGLDVPKEYRSDGNHRTALFRLFLDLGVPASLVDATRNAATITRDPIVFGLPLLWLEVRGEVADPTVDVNSVPPADKIFEIPSYTFDKHTRAGKAAIGQLATKCASISKLLPTHVAEYRAKDALRMTAFYVEAAPVTRRLDWSQSVPLELLGRQADMRSVGVRNESIQTLLDLVTAEIPCLNELRENMVRLSFVEANGARKDR